MPPTTRPQHTPRLSLCSCGASKEWWAELCVACEESRNRLIAATNELVDALRAAEGVVLWAIDHGAQSEPVLRYMRRALAKVEGS